MADRNDGGKTRWLDRPGNVDKLWYGLLILCVVVTLADLVYEKHPYFAAEYLFGFYSGFGILAGIGLILAAKAWRRFVMRKEDYYDDD